VNNDEAHKKIKGYLGITEPEFGEIQHFGTRVEIYVGSNTWYLIGFNDGSTNSKNIEITRRLNENLNSILGRITL